MEKVNYPDLLILQDSEIEIVVDTQLRVNKTSKAVIINGNRAGFLSLSNLINVYHVYLYNPIIVTDFQFVQSPIQFKIIQDEEIFLPNGKVIAENESSFNWCISEINLFMITGLIHSLGYANNELHLDDQLQDHEISVYCIVK